MREETDLAEQTIDFHPGIPIPPEDLIYRVTGSPDAYWFHHGGKLTLDYFRDALGAVGRDLADFSDIYDFGCGPGRLTPWLAHYAPTARLYGSDGDAEAVDWLRQHNPTVGDIRVNQWLPPLPFRNVGFDLVIGYSVFTHLDAGYQDAWLAELHRVTRPGAILLLTVNLDRSWQHSMEHSPAEFHGHMRALRAQLEEQGILFYLADRWEEHFPDFYHTTWHTANYIRAHWSRWFTIEAIVEGSSDHLHQAVVVLRRRERSWMNGAAARLSPDSATLPAGQTSVAISWDTGDEIEGQVWVRYDGGEEGLFAQSRSGAQLADFLVGAGEYTFALYRGVFPSSPAALGIPAAARTIQQGYRAPAAE